MQSRNNLRFISVDSIYSNLDKHAKHLPVITRLRDLLQAFFSQKGKIHPLKKLEKHAQAQVAFGHLGQLDDDQNKNFT